MKEFFKLRYNPKQGFNRADKIQVILAGTILCIVTIIAFRSWTAHQVRMEDPTPFLQILGYHVHHWQVALFFLPILLLLGCLFSRGNKTGFKIIIVLLIGDLTMFVDGMLIFLFNTQ